MTVPQVSVETQLSTASVVVDGARAEESWCQESGAALGSIQTTEVAIVGLGAWGLCVLERMLATARVHRKGGCRIRVHVIEPSRPGPGVYSPNEPHYFLLNTPCGQVSLAPFADGLASHAYELSLYDWAARRGYRWIGDTCRVGCRGGRPITEHDFLPRRVMGEYLEWFFQELVAAAPRGVEIVQHRTQAIDVVAQRSGQEHVLLADGDSLLVDHVVLTTGHTENIADFGSGGLPLLDPYPVSAYTRQLVPGQPATIAGMGLVSMDVLAAMTMGRGGTFVDDGDRKHYVPSGREPAIRMYSRSGVFHCAKPPEVIDATDDYQLGVWTPAVTEELTRRASGPLDARRDVLPLVFAEMQLRFYSQAALLQYGQGAGAEVRRQLIAGWQSDTLRDRVAGLTPRYGHFDPEEHFFPTEDRIFSSSAEYKDYVQGMVEADVTEALRPSGSSPLKSAYEVLRFLRDPMRQVIEFGGLSRDSYRDFSSNIRGRIARLVAGPPVPRAQQLLALLEAGVVQLPFGPAPSLIPTPHGRGRLASTRLARPYGEDLPWVVRGYLDDPSIHRSASELLSQLYRRGRTQQFRAEDTQVGSIALSRDFHPINAAGQPEERLWVFGAVTEGVRYFTHYVPSPHSRLRAFLDAQACAEQILE